MIKPTIGRIVWFHPSGSTPNEQPQPAIICYVWSDTMINLSVFDSNGNQYSQTSVTLYQGESPVPDDRFAEWMPYQQGQAAKTEHLEKQLAEKQ